MKISEAVSVLQRMQNDLGDVQLLHLSDAEGNQLSLDVYMQPGLIAGEDYDIVEVDESEKDDYDDVEPVVLIYPA